MSYLVAEDLSVGYSGRVIVDGVDISVNRGKILSLIGPNGSGKSTILKTITRHLEEIAGVVRIDGLQLGTLSEKVLAKRLSVVLTDRINPELMTCEEVVAMGRYPYTGKLGLLGEKDQKAVDRAIEMVGAQDFAGNLFAEISDGQKQRILLGRAICQEPEIIVLDEPTSFLDIRHKIELFGILRKMAREAKVAVILSLHEIDLAFKVADDIICIKDGAVAAFGAPNDILTEKLVRELYDIEAGSYNAEFGSIELARPAGRPQIFVLAGGGAGISEYRKLQKLELPFSTGILYENDVDYQVARVLASETLSIPAFTTCPNSQIIRAQQMIDSAEYFLDTGVAVREFNTFAETLRKYAEAIGKKIVFGAEYCK